MKRIPELDGLRGSAICMVVAHHYVYYKFLPYLGPRWGWAGVDLFFVLSGFLITGILLKTQANHEGLKNFYMRRIFRLFPLYYICLTVYFIANAVSGHALSWQFIASFLLYLQAIFPHSWLGLNRDVLYWTNPGFAVLWSLSIEEFFYLLWAPVIFLVKGKERTLFVILGTIIFIEPFIRFFCYSSQAAELRQMFFARADSLAAGAVIAILMRNYGPQVFEFCKRRYVVILSSASALLVAAVGGDLLYGRIPYMPGSLAERTYSAVMYTVVWFAFSLVLLLVLTHSGSSRWLPRLMRNRALMYMGTISYCVYLIHFPLRQLFIAHMNRGLGILLALIASIVLASLSWKFLEGPLARWKEKRFAYENQNSFTLISR